MAKQLLAIAGDARGWTAEEIAAGLQRSRFRPCDRHDPLRQLERQRGWWQGKINVRVQFRAEELMRAGRFAAMASPQTQHDREAAFELRAAAPATARDMAFAIMVAQRECFAIASEHDVRINEYQRRMGACAS